MTFEVRMQQEDPVPGALAARLREVAQRYGLAEIYAFGSRGREIAARVRGAGLPARHADSDVDIGVQPERERRLGAHERVRVAGELEDLFEARRVDVVVLPEAGPFLALDVIRGELLYCADADAQAEHELYVLRRAADLAPFERARRRHILREQAS